MVNTQLVEWRLLIDECRDLFDKYSETFSERLSESIEDLEKWIQPEDGDEKTMVVGDQYSLILKFNFEVGL